MMHEFFKIIMQTFFVHKNTVFHTKRVEKIAAKRDVTSNHRNTLDHAKWPPKISSLARMNGACRDRARKL